MLRSASDVQVKHHRASLPWLAPEAMREGSHLGHTNAKGSTLTSAQESHPRALRQALHTPLSRSVVLLHSEQIFLRLCLRCLYSSGNLVEKHALQKPLKPDCAATRCRLGCSPAHQPYFGVSTRGMLRGSAGLGSEVFQTLSIS